MKETHGTWQTYVYEDSQYVVHVTDSEERGKIATTHYQVENRTKRYTRLKIKLETGRKNQIRVHCGHHKFPIAGDKKYGALTDPIQRLCLHAYSLAFQHPITNKRLHFISPSPTLFDRLA